MDIRLTNVSLDKTFENYEMQFKALSDQKRLKILNILCNQDSACVCDLSEMIDMPQSKLSYHLKILFRRQSHSKGKKWHMELLYD